ncbi:cell division protein FtsA [Alkalicoccus urumqiensis]|uniref:Cell division protein n=1 Tax=Alkalicoccus urumqiensis TaxID=1548213 RepID=A0A2P6MGJ2_ALKUR|nr:cell division protein FtsA [Alkalicoccus urumqiensis]PRO65408.1 cell division protein [Alkalicoccus urumqiensis]
MTSPLLFGLDIGTRSVVGLLLEQNGNSYHVTDMVRLEHTERSMLDGQIHNVLEVAETIKQVKQTLEERHGPLPAACVAAAGRSLRTVETSYETPLDGRPVIDRAGVLHMELAAVQNAQRKLLKNEAVSTSNDACVGYSVVRYRLDNEIIGSLIDQSGTTAGVDIIATFLPKVVVDSLLAALERAGLQMEALTLEPIAAMDVLIPSSMRRLNVALVDIGAGTSDIAITAEGTVKAYGMVPRAGDAVTEALSDHYLLDFPEAERIKRLLDQEKTVSFTDILGMEQIIPSDEAVAALNGIVQETARAIANEILRLNGEAPKAVMLVGGGSLTPGMQQAVAEMLELPENRVALRDIRALSNITFQDSVEPTPELVTPVGIAIAAKENPIEYKTIYVNGRSVRMFDIHHLNAGDALLASGMNLQDLYGAYGEPVMVTINGRKRTFHGTPGGPPSLSVNGREVEVDERVNDGDHLQAIKGKDGSDAVVRIADLDEVFPLKITWNGKQRTVHPDVVVNKHKTDPSRTLKNGDELMIKLPSTINGAASLLGERVTTTSSDTAVYIDNSPVDVFQKAGIYRNGSPASADTPIHANDTVEVLSPGTATVSEALEVWSGKPAIHTIQITFNEEPVTLEKQRFECFREKEKLSLDTEIYPEDELKAEKTGNDSFIFQDVFAEITIPRPEDRSLKPVIRRGGESVSFSTPIIHGDTLTLDWEAQTAFHSGSN